MGIFDNAVPEGNITKPLLIALGALIVGKMVSGGGSEPQSAEPAANAPEPTASAPEPTASAPEAPTQSTGDGGLLGGLGGLIESLTKNGHGETVDSWVKPGENKPIAPGDLGSALGKTAVSEISKRTGISEEELLAQLSKVLPGIVDKLTADGKVPTTNEVASLLGTKV
ncbi:YidB family protein [Phyllobacterium sp. 21LDTY02-6]|uniref:YidB family protein n=2 Tax=Phyllobacterium TaxID=28100 RepID=UPI002020AA20|nr:MULTISPECIES: YidB family protein [unclassified Phyllobacterium]MCO4316580.1 YidB family protein [Phyllobacterium sp. 21LDTY02-6]MCX8280618.1 YidB family protein [Phyllobacterium sp. 0TCS1.6C]MCX8292805.1 YidB family protein [Phyllobacterium sp. 0TCS1.6A]